MMRTQVIAIILYSILNLSMMMEVPDEVNVQKADFGLTLLLWVALFALSQLLTPDPEVENARPKTLDDFNFPTATEGRAIPLNWGTDKLKGPNVIWYGDLRTVPIVEKIKVSLFKKKKVTTGFQYYLGFQMGICHGPAVLKAIYIGDEKVWSGTQSTDGEIAISTKDLRGTFSFYTGSTTQSVNSYLATHQNPCPAYRGLCHGVWQGGYVGNSTTIKPWSFEIQRIPNALAPSYSAVNTDDCNPMELLYEIFTNVSWGYGYASSEIDTTDWSTQAVTLYNEGNGTSFIVANQKNATDIIKEVEKQIDGHLRIDPTTGKWKCVLIRDGYSTSGLKTADVDSVTELLEFSRGSWENTINIVRIMYKRRANDYTDGYAQAHDAANMKIQGRRVPAMYNYIGLRDDTLANKIAWREVRAHSYPFAKLRMKINRTFWDAFVGEVFLFTWTFENFSVADLAFRITKVDFGTTENPEILIDAVQDVFSWRAASFADVDPSSWTLPSTNLIPFAATEQIAFELPYAIQRRNDTTDEGQIWATGVAPGRSESGFEIMQRNAAGTPSGSYYSAGDESGFTWDGVLDGAINQDATTIDVTCDVNINEFLASIEATEVGEYLYNLFMIEDELIACTDVAEITGGLRFTGCLRGFCDTAQATHVDALKVWFLSTGGGIADTAFTNDYNVDLKLLPYDQHGNKVSISDAALTVIAVDLDFRPRRPYPPTFLKWNASGYPTTVTITSDVVVTFNRRDFRILNENSQHATDAETIDPTFPANNSTMYRLKLWDDTSLVYTGAWNAGAATLTMTFEKILRYLDGLPSTLKMSLDTKHTYSSVDYESTQEIEHSASVNSSTFDDDHWFGVCSPSTTCPNAWTNVPDTGSYGFTIGTNLSGDVEGRINGGSWVQVIASGNTVGSLTGVTAADTIEVRHLDSSSSDEILLTVNSPTSSVDGFGILIFA